MQELLKLNTSLSAVLDREYREGNHDRPAILVALMSNILLLNKDRVDYSRGKSGGYILTPLTKVETNFSARKAALIANIENSLNQKHPFQIYHEYTTEIKPILERMLVLARELTIEAPVASPILPAHTLNKADLVGYTSDDSSDMTNSPASKSGDTPPTTGNVPTLRRL